MATTKLVRFSASKWHLKSNQGIWEALLAPQRGRTTFAAT